MWRRFQITLFYMIDANLLINTIRFKCTLQWSKTQISITLHDQITYLLSSFRNHLVCYWWVFGKLFSIVLDILIYIENVACFIILLLILLFEHICLVKFQFFWRSIRNKIWYWFNEILITTWQWQYRSLC